MSDARELPPIPSRMAKLPRFRIMGLDAPVPWFVAWTVDGKASRPGEGVPEFRAIDTTKFLRALAQGLCWVCGEKLGRHKAFVIGPMCAINRINSEPPSHLECAVFSAQACPFLTRPRMRRNTKDLPDDRIMPAGLFIERNPGVVVVWVTREFKPFKAPGGILIRLGEPDKVLWFAQGRPAIREQVTESIDSGFPILLDAARKDGPEAIAELEKYRLRAMPLLPAAR